MPAELAIKNQFEALASLALGKNEVVILYGTRRERRLETRVSDDVSGERAIWIKAHIGLAEHLIWRHAALHSGEFARLEVSCHIEGQHSPVLIVVQRCGIREADIAIDEGGGQSGLLPGKGDDF